MGRPRAAAGAIMSMLLLMFAASGPVSTAPVWAAPVTLDHTDSWTATSADGARYRISMAMPSEPSPAQGFPVIYLLDGGYSFATAVEAYRVQRPLVAPAIIVGIEAEDRARRGYDFTLPVKADALLPNRFDPPPGPVGGAEAFFAFIDTVVKPSIEARVPVDRRQQTLMGHSLGGLFVLHVLFAHPEAFQAYVAGSPSIWWGDRAILGKLDGFLAKPGTGRRLLLTVGSEEQRVTPAQDALVAADVAVADKAAVIAMNRCLIEGMAAVDSARWLGERLAQAASPKVSVSFVEFAGESHVSVIPAYVSRGLTFAIGTPTPAPALPAKGAPTSPSFADLHRCTAPYSAH